MSENKTTVVVTPSNVNSLIKGLLTADRRLVNLAVRGEITNVKTASSGHCFFSLSDGSSILSAAVWKNTLQYLNTKPAEGMSVICKGSVSVYEPSGTYRLICSDIEAEGQGAQSRAVYELVERLRKQGMLDRKRPLPEFPGTIAVVTSPTGAVVHDIEKTLLNRFPCVKMLVIPAVVQGESAVDSIVNGIEYAQTTDADVIIFGRGGGAAEDLSAFNSEKVALAVFNSGIPTISAVGHEIDVTVADLVADKSVATPTAAAVAAVPSREELYRRLSELRGSLSDRLNAKIGQKRDALKNIMERTDELLTRCYRTKESELRGVEESIKRLMQRKLEVCGAELEKHIEVISALDPLSTLKRGYSIVKLGDKTVTDASELEAGNEVEIRFGSGTALAEIKEIRD